MGLKCFYLSLTLTVSSLLLLNLSTILNPAATAVAVLPPALFSAYACGPRKTSLGCYVKLMGHGGDANFTPFTDKLFYWMP